ncbi:MAG: indole-3-glycerol-phosphate synthase [Burkholderiales bacterium]|jgi:indole-3-glycerol phosphate synthase|nr:indole-3-glycerol-phosphate synthase [Burkholderiales bacterium]
MSGSISGRFFSAVVAENERGFVAVIPDIKCISPKEGDLLRGRDPVETAKFLVRAGAPVLSVVTERERFGGSPQLLSAIVQAVDVPVLRKDFITSENQLLETAELGAAAVLLICATTDEKNLMTLYEKALTRGMEPLVEVHTAQEMELANALGARLVGINNRNIVSFERDDGGPDRTAALAFGVPVNALLISESGILSPEDAKLAVSSGANAVLVGTALWQARDMGDMYQALRVAWTSKGPPETQKMV